MRAKYWLKVLGVNIALVLVLMEIVLRVQEPYLHLLARGDYESPNNLILTEYHPVWHHQLRGGLRDLELRTSFEGGVSYRVSTNALGCRYRDVQIPKPPGVHRVLVIGDSFTQGQILAVTPSVALERVIGGEVVNCGTATYSPLLMYLRIKNQLLTLEPDAIIINVDNTDLYDDWVRYRPYTQFDGDVPIAATFPSWRTTENMKTLMTASAAFRMGFSVLRRLQLQLSPPPTAATAEAIDWFHTADPDAPRWRDAFAFLTANLTRILDLCDAHHIRCAITIYPHQGQIDGSQHRAFAERLGQYARSKGVFFFDAFVAIAEAARTERLYYRQDMHFNPRGFAVWSEAFARSLTTWAR
jgi:hypothetical protein